MNRIPPELLLLGKRASAFDRPLTRQGEEISGTAQSKYKSHELTASIAIVLVCIVFFRRIRGSLFVFLALLVLFFVYSSYDRGNFFVRAKSENALKVAVEYVLQKRGITASSPNEFIDKNPNCCSVSQYYDGVAHGDGTSHNLDKRSIFSVVNDKLFSLTGLEYYVVFVTFPGETSSSVVEISGNGGRGSSTIAKSPASIEGDGNGSH